MKKFKAIFLLSVLAIGVVLYITHTRNQKNDFYALENIEALANGEGNQNGCMGTGSLDCQYVLAKAIWLGR